MRLLFVLLLFVAAGCTDSNKDVETDEQKGSVKRIDEPGLFAEKAAKKAPLEEEKSLEEFRQEMNRDAINEGDCQFAFQVEDDGSSRYIGMGICEYWEEIYDSYLANDWPTSLSLSDVSDLMNMEAYLEATAINGANFSWQNEFYLPEKQDCRRIGFVKPSAKPL